MRLILCLLLFSGIMCSSSCKNMRKHKNTELNILFEEVMTVHDEVMPKMSAISRSKRNLKKMIDNTSIKLSDSMRLAIRKNIVKLDEADESMMSWMYAFKKPVDKTEEEIRSYYDSEMIKIKEVKELFDTSLSNAEKLLENQ